MKNNSTAKSSQLNFKLSLALSALSGILLSLPFSIGDLWFLSWFGFVPLFFCLNRSTAKKVFFNFFLSGIVFFSLTIYWLIHVTLIGQVVLIIYLAIYFGLFGVLIYSRRRIPILLLLFYIPSVWVLLEFIRSHLFTGFGWALLGYSQYLNLPVIQTADFTGAYGVSFLIMVANIAIWLVISEIRNQKPEVRNVLLCSLVFVFSLLLALGYGLFRLNEHDAKASSVRLSIVQGNIPQEMKWRPESGSRILEKYLNLTEKCASSKPELIIWPESSVPGVLDEGNFLSVRLSNFVKQSEIPLLVGAIMSQGDKFYNSAILFSSQGEMAQRYDKIHLVPFGEYLPLKSIFGFANNVAPIPIGDFTSGEDYKLFTLKDGKTKFSVLICFEDVFPDLSREFVRRGASFLVNITNDAWFKVSTAPYQHLQASVFRAVENRRPLVRAANTGISCFIDSRGRINDRVQNSEGTDIFISGYKTHDIKINNNSSPYTQYGDIFILGCFLLFIISGLAKKPASYT